MKKKIVCILLSVMMFLLPVLSQADGFLDKAEELIEEGCEVTVTSQFIPGDVLMSSVGDEKAAAAVMELFGSTQLKCSVQSVDDLMQFALRLMINDTEAVEVIFAKDKDELLACSDLLGNDTYVITRDELQQLIEKSGIFADAEGTKNVTMLLESLLDPQGLTEEDAEKLEELAEKTAEEILALLEANTSDTEGETLQMNGQQTGKGIAITFPKEQIGEICVTFLNRLAEIPSMKTIVEQTGLTADRIRELGDKIGTAFQEDPVLRVYIQNDDVTIVAEAVFGPSADNTAELRNETVIGIAGDDLTINGLSVITNTEKAQMLIESHVKAGEDWATFAETLSMTENGQVKKLIDVDGTLAVTGTDPYVGTYGYVTFSMPETQTTIKLELSGTGKYSEDELNYSHVLKIYSSPDITKPLMSLNQELYIGPAEAYLTGNKAVHIANQSEEDMQILLKNWETNAAVKLITLLPKLPESLQNILWNSFQ